MPYEVRWDGYCISDDRTRLDLATVHRYLSAESYWAQGVSREQVERQTAYSPFVFGVYQEATGGAPEAQLGFARVLSDATRFAYICDVYIATAAQGQGLGKRLMAAIMAHPELLDVRRWVLATRDAHGLYAQFGFGPPRKPEMWMFIDPDKSKPARWV
jgi:GNAT superfamily N-acetyltransferase